MKKAFGLFLWLAGAVIIFYIRFTNIDMSETRLLVSYWKELLVGVVFTISGYLLFWNKND